MARIFIKRKNSITYGWYLSYLAVLLIPLIVVIVNYQIFHYTIKSEITSANYISLEYIQQKSDLMLKEIQSFNFQVTRSLHLQELLPSTNPLIDGNPEHIVELQDQLINYNQLNSPIDFYFIYLNNSDLIITSNSISDSKTFYNSLNLKESISYDDWINQMLENTKPYYISSTKINNVRKNMITCSQSLPIIQHAKKVAALVTMVDAEKFFPVFPTFIKKNGTIVILKDSETILSLSSSSKDYRSLNLSDLLTKNDGMIETIYEKEKLVISHITSDMNDLKYAIIVPYNNIWSKNINIIRISIAEILVLIGISLFLINFFIKKNYAPISDIVNAVSYLSEPQTDNKNNELHFIKRVIEKTVTENKEIQSFLDKQNKILSNNFLERIIKGNIMDYDTLNVNLTNYGINFQSSNFVVLMVYINDISNLFEDDKSIDNIEKFKLAQFIISNVLSELIDEAYHSYACNVDDLIAFVINIDNMNDTTKTKLINISEKSQEFIIQNFNIDFSVSISNCHFALSQIPKAYKEAVTAMEFKFILQDRKTIHFDDISQKETKDYNYSFENEQQLVNNIKSGNFESTKIILENIFAANFKDKIMSVQMAKCLMFDLISTLIKTINEIYAKSNIDVLKEIAPVESLLACQSVNEMKEKMVFILGKLCDFINSNQENSLKIKTTEFVLKNFTDINLSVSSIADSLNVHAGYLSTTFKEQSGEGLLNYISRVRIENAKELIMTTNKKLDAIAVEVGYANIRTFTRVFKKYEGVSPAQFKEMNYKF